MEFSSHDVTIPNLIQHHKSCNQASYSQVSLTSGSAITSRILRSESMAKLANRLLRTYSPGRLSGSTLMDIMVPGPFSLWEWYTGATGGLLYPGDAVNDNTQIHVLKLFGRKCGNLNISNQVQTKYIQQY